MKQRRAVVFDRDGTLVVERHYLSDPDQLELLPGVAEGLHKLAKLDLILVIVTNQSGVARGYFDMSRVDEIHARLMEMLEREGVKLDGIYICPHHPDDGCACRKPASELIIRAGHELRFDLGSAFVIGDKECDIELGKRVGATTFLVRTGYGENVAVNTQVNPTHVVDNVLIAVPIIEKIMHASNERGDKALPKMVEAA